MHLILPTFQDVPPSASTNALGMECRYLLVELHNYVHLSTVYGEDFAEEAARTLEQRIQLWGASVMELRPGVFLATFMSRAAKPLAESSRDFVLRMESWQLELAATPFEFDSGSALPVVTVRSVGAGHLGPIGSGFQFPEALDHMDALSPQLPLPQFGAGWCLDYKRGMAQAVAVMRELTAEQFCLEFQPVVCHGPAAVELYAEGLLRVPGLSEIGGPASFIPALERLGIIRALDHAVTMAVIRELEKEPHAKLGCNVSASSLMLDSFWGGVVERLAERPDVAARLTIEITETAQLPDFDVAVNFVQRFKELGCQIALDDFGSGHTSIAFARAVKPNIIKIDGLFLHRARSSESDVLVFQNLIALCRTLAPLVVVEQVENEADAQIAKEAGAHALQGFGVAKSKARHRCRVPGLDSTRLS
jgi:EAL domain-containing protein (putative c-di-GMP-specific phosphodiesterase class I)